MTQQQKLLAKLATKPSPRDFKWNELVKLLNSLGFNSLGFKQIKGKGSRRKFYHTEFEKLIIIHEPHPGNVLKLYQVNEVVENLKEIGIIE